MEYLCVYVPWSLYTSWVLGASLIAIFIPLERLREEMVYGGVAALAFAAFCQRCSPGLDARRGVCGR